MNVLRTFFETDANQIVLNFGHGLVFFLIGFSIFLKSKRWSELTLAKSLRRLGAFAVLNAIGDWGLVFLPVQEEVFSPHVMGVLWVMDEALLALSYAFLLGFGCRLVADTASRYEWLPRIVPVLYALWFGTLLFALITGRVDPLGGKESLVHFEVAYRYGFAFTGALISAWALYIQQRELIRLDLTASVPPLRWVGIAVAVYGVAAGLLVPPGPYFPANVINQLAFIEWTGLPVRVFTGLIGTVMAIFIIIVLNVFDLEIQRRVEGARRMQAIVDERVRIARDLHDGIIQTLYALGLALEGVKLSLDESAKEAREEIRVIMLSLDQAVKDVRGYIHQLKTPADEVSLDEQLRVLQKELQREARVPVVLKAESVEAGILSTDAIGNILLTVREAVSNALRHARASKVEIVLARNADLLTVSIRDDGVGFDPETLPEAVGGEHQGIENMHRRAEAIGGRLVIHSEATGGTDVTLEIPLHA